MPVIILFLVGFIRVVFFFAVLYFIIRWISNLITPRQTSSNQYSNAGQSPKTGETIIRFNEKGSKIVDKDKGEYVDFEEVD